MKRKYKYKALKSLNAGHNNYENDASTNPLETSYLNEAVNFIKDSENGVITVTRDIQYHGENISQRIELLSEDVEDLNQAEILEEINRRFQEEHG